jgi:hypothetical protein
MTEFEELLCEKLGIDPAQTKEVILTVRAGEPLIHVSVNMAIYDDDELSEAFERFRFEVVKESE